VPEVPDVPVLPDLPPGTIAVGWATVELDRAARELAHLLVGDADIVDGPASPILGARTRLGRTVASDGREIWLAILEPMTEGRLAATLARAGEGWAATWTSSPAGSPPQPGGSRLSAARPGPFGPERLILGGPPAGPHRLLVEVATIGS
jgi:hypothetical protein